MPLDYDKLMATEDVDLPLSYDDSKAILYALSVGMGVNPVDLKELPYVYEQGEIFKIVPTFATVLVPDMFPPGLGWDFSQVLHSEQRMQLHKPLPKKADLLINKKVSDVFDWGPRKGALFLFEAEGRIATDNTLLFTLGCTVIARGDGGFGGPNGKGPRPHRAPKRDPDFTCDLSTREDQALLFRLTGDRNPLHADPSKANQAGFDKPILHGMCSYGVACRAILKTICDYDYKLIKCFDARFTSPVVPGDIITTEIWQDGNIISFRCSVKERNTVVLRNGRCILAS
ncbi:MAG: 3-alpha,7-alpha,12-alpha-trihydroxy-5-beta-cholest-24-enoyl-CoA hydratase [Gammaproteobacteria bacterium]|nr:3-alpha,7-alpha,12-alpha-trihydroxy-5-beta-cholest-24-enoyl-CoA hydratase [Gammaproteobacteria bacterium]